MEPTECGELSSEETFVCKWKFTLDPGVLCIKSPIFGHSGSSVWCLQLYIEDIVFSRLYFHLLSSQNDKSLNVKFKATLKMDWAEAYVVSGKSPSIKPNEKLYMNFPPASVYDAEWSICAEVTILSGSPAVQKKIAPHTGPLGVTEDLAALLDSGDHSDVVLCAGGTELKAHKLLLSARSPVFAAMFEHDTWESQNSRVHIDDIEPEPLWELLRYVYTGRTSGVRQTPDELLVAADKYALDGLKQLCEQELAGRLNADNAAQLGVVALRHSCEELKWAVICFIKQNLMSVLGTDGWSDAVRNHSELAAELSRLIANKSVE